MATRSPSCPGRRAPASAGDEFVLFVDLRGIATGRWPSCPPRPGPSTGIAVDGQAERWYREGQRERDRALLRRVVDQAFCSSWGDDALELLGDLAFQDGRFAEALATYRQLVPDRPEDTSPGPPRPERRPGAGRGQEAPLPRRGGRADRRPAEIEALAKRYPGASARSPAGRGRTRRSSRRRSAPTASPRRGQPDGRWPTFAGALTRTKVVAGAIDVGSLQWRVRSNGSRPTRTGYAYGAAADGDDSSPSPRTAAGLSPDRPGRPGHRLRRVAR